jgi:hypothetical protein
MTKSILFSVALSALASAAAYASPAKSDHSLANDSLNAPASLVDAKQATVIKSPMAQLDDKAASALVVAENRREFGSQYQRER